MKIISILALVLSLSSLSCKSSIHGNLNINFEIYEPYVYLIKPLSFDELITSYQGKVIDSAFINSDGHFEFNKSVVADKKEIYQLLIQRKNERYKNKLNNDNWENTNYIPIILSNKSDVEITANAENLFKSYLIKNPDEENISIIKLRELIYQSYEKHLFNLKEHDEENLIEHEKAFRNFRNDIIDFTNNVNHSSSILLAIKWIAPNDNYENIPEFISNQCAEWKSSNENDLFAKQLCDKVKKEKLPILIGDGFPDFVLPMSTGKKENIKSLLGKKLTIVDMWASWCGPCRKENKNVLVPIWDEYNTSGLQIIGYALDSDEKLWKKAIDKDGAGRWLHASHLLGDESPLFESIRISTIPSNFILNDEGIIIAKNLHGEELTSFVKDYFKK